MTVHPTRATTMGAVELGPRTWRNYNKQEKRIVGPVYSNLQDLLNDQLRWLGSQKLKPRTDADQDSKQTGLSWG